MQKMEIILNKNEWNEQMNKTVKSGGERLRFSTFFDYVFSLKLQMNGLNCWFKSR